MSMPDLVYARLSCSKVGVLAVGTDTDTGLMTRIATTVCPKGQVKIYFIITWARKHSMILERWHFLH